MYVAQSLHRLLVLLFAYTPFICGDVTYKADNDNIQDILTVVDDIPLDVTKIDLRRNLITSLPESAFITFQNLEEILLKLNMITEIFNDTFKGLHKLKVLDLANNQLTVLPVLTDSATSILELFLSFNDITYLPANYLDDLINLNVFHMKNNHLLAISSWPKLRKLRSIYLNRNMIGIIPTNGYQETPLLQYMALTNNNIEKLPNISFLSHLDTVDLALNKIVYINASHLEGLQQLEELLLDNNHIKTIDLPFLPALKKLRLHNNELEYIADATLSNLPSVEYLYLENNRLRQFPNISMISATIHEVNVKNNLIPYVNLSHFIGLQSLQTLYLVDNLLEGTFELPSIPTLVMLNLADNEITDILLYDLPSLQTLNAESNKLTTFPQIQMETLSQNNTGIHAQDRLASFKKLELTRNNFAGAVCVPKYPALTDLDLSYMEITKVCPEMWGYLTNLMRINLKGNMLTEMPDMRLASPHLFRKLFLAGNHISSFNKTYVSHLQSGKFYVNSNKWHCDHTLCWLMADSWGFSGYNLYCSTPLQLEGKLFEDLIYDDLNCLGKFYY